MIYDLIVHSSSGDGSPIWLLIFGPLAGAGTYWSFWRYYRNTDKTHQFERETTVVAQPVQGGEEAVDHISRTRDSRTDNANDNDYRERVQRIG